MTPQRQRIAIAEECGWRCEVVGAGWAIFNPSGKTISSGHRADHNIQSLADYIAVFYGPLCSYERHPLPDYLNDLNAMHEAEVVLEDNMQVANTYWTILAEACCADDEDLHTSTRYRYIGSATAAQRAEAFLRAICKWKD